MDAYIIATSRTPIGRAFKGALKDERPEDLAAHAIRSLLAKVPQIEASEIAETILGIGVPGGQQGSNLARVVNVMIGLDSVPAHVVSRFCASSAQAIRSAANSIAAGEGHCYIAAGVESISSFLQTDVDNLPGSKSPHFDAAQLNTLANAANLKPWQDPRILGQLPDVYAPMGQTAENLASTLGITREDQDAFALRSQKLAAASVANGFFQREIAPYRLANGDVFATDQSVRGGSTMEGLADLQPIFREGGSVTAGNACPLNDGAAAVMIVSGEFLKRHQLQPLAKVLGVATSALSPEIMGQGPVDAIADLEARLGLQGQVDQYEINEAFAVQVLANIRTLKLDPETVNLVGGSIAIGHPYGMTGARIAGTLINSLSSHDHSIGIEAMCVAGGQGMAIALERTN